MEAQVNNGDVMAAERRRKGHLSFTTEAMNQHQPYHRHLLSFFYPPHGPLVKPNLDDPPVRRPYFLQLIKSLLEMADVFYYYYYYSSSSSFSSSSSHISLRAKK